MTAVSPLLERPLNDADGPLDDANLAVSHDRHLEVHSSVVFKLGEDLISDEVQALVELVKNCYDADSPYARVVIDTTYSNANTGAGIGERQSISVPTTRKAQQQQTLNLTRGASPSRIVARE